MTIEGGASQDFDDGSVVASSLLSTFHGRQRRQERSIGKADLKNARRYGMEEDAGDNRVKYTYGGVVFVFDPNSNCEITSYPAPDEASESSGTKCSRPVLLEKKRACRTPQAKKKYKKDRQFVLAHKERWTSHTVLVVDMSGSMRRDDVSGARCRSDGVWIALARDFVKRQLEQKTATMFDLVSVVVMNKSADSIIICYPIHDWYLYNKFIQLREWKTLRPQGPGNYLPALTKAENLLDINPSGSCSLSLMLFSDGKPSDSGPFKERMGAIASKFGRRLSVCCIGMADESNEDFSTLESMVEEASHFGAHATFNKPSLSTDSLSHIVTSLVSSLATSKCEMTDLRTGKVKSVRLDIRRERKGAPDDEKLTGAWRVFHDHDPIHYVPDVWSWSYELNDFVTLMNPRCIGCHWNIADASFEVRPDYGSRCPQCNACFVCWRCGQNKNLKGKSQANILRQHMGSEHCKKCTRDRRSGKIVKWAIPSFSFAVKKLVFGEGAERIVFKVRFLDHDRKFIGPKMVAKESRFIQESHGTYEDRMNYHRDFLRTQAIASELAEQFNVALEALKGHLPDAIHPVLDDIPRIRFLKPLVVEALTGDAEAGELNILVEEQLEGRYTKFNSNKGYVHPSVQEALDSDPTEESVFASDLQQDVNGALDVIEEGSDDEEDEEIFDTKVNAPVDRSSCSSVSEIRPEHVPQAFSHFTYEKSKKQLLVVDLQGVLKELPHGRCEYVLTDPAIHKRKKNRNNQLSQWTFGRTDHGEAGMRHYFATHQCNEVCRMLGLTENRRSAKP